MNTYVGKLSTGGELAINVGVGIHRLFFKDNTPIGKKKDVYLDVVVNSDSE